MNAGLGSVREERWPAEATGSEHVTSARSKRPSLFHYSPALVLFIIMVADSGRWTDPDLWGHLRFGQAVLAQGHLVLHDPYSYSAPGHLWLNHEWLTEVLMGWLYNHWGILGLKLMKFACSALTVVFLALGMAETGAPTDVQFALLLTGALAIAPQMQFRPQAFTFALLSALLAILSRLTYRGQAMLWLAVPILALWANLHGGFIMGLATLGIYTAAVCGADVMAGQGLRRTAWLTLTLAGASLVTLLTPYGLGTWRAVLHALGNPYTRRVIVDWQPLTKAFLGQLHTKPTGTYYMVFAVALFAGLALTFFLSPRANDIPLFCVAAVMMAAAFIAIRNLPLAVIASLTPLARHLRLVLEARRESLGKRERERRERSGRMNQAVVTVIALAVGIQTGLFSKRIVTDEPYPVGAIRFMRAHQLEGNILAHFGWGEYVIWHMTPASRVFMDGRYDTVYPRKVLDDYLHFHFALGAAGNVLKKYPHDFVLIKNDIPAYKLMRARADWKMIYSDGDCFLFARADSHAAKLAGVPVVADPPKSFFP